MMPRACEPVAALIASNIYHFSCLRLLRRGPNGRFMFVIHFRRDLVLVTLHRRPFGSAPEP